MDAIRNSTASQAAVEAGLVRAAESDTEKSTILLKKALNSDKDIVSALLAPISGRLDIKA